eukprot:scaffold104111_cov65-Attheya_sp.AAC.3
MVEVGIIGKHIDCSFPLYLAGRVGECTSTRAFVVYHDKIGAYQCPCEGAIQRSLSGSEKLTDQGVKKCKLDLPNAVTV